MERSHRLIARGEHHAENAPGREPRSVAARLHRAAGHRAGAQQLTVAWGKNVVVDNRPGASGMIGTEIATKAEADGHVLLGHTSSYPATAAVREKLPFDPARAIVPVAAIAKTPLVLVVHPSVPAKSVKELVALAR